MKKEKGIIKKDEESEDLIMGKIIFLIFKIIYTFVFVIIFSICLMLQFTLLLALKFYFYLRLKLIKNLILYPKGFDRGLCKFISFRAVEFLGEIDEQMREKLRSR